MFDLEQLMKELLKYEKNNPFTGICTISKYPNDIRLFDLAKMNSQDVDNAFKYLEEILKKKQENESKTMRQDNKCTTSNKAVNTTTTNNTGKAYKYVKPEASKVAQPLHKSSSATSFDTQKQQLQEERKKLEEELELAKLRAENQRLRDQIKNFNKHL